MTDKFKNTIPVAITFAAGEQPSAQKLSALSSLNRTSAALLEKAIGDIWNQTGDTVLSDHPLYIPSLGRMFGSSDDLNNNCIRPSVGSNVVVINESVLSGLTTYPLSFTPIEGDDNDELSTFLQSHGFSATPAASRAEVEDSTSWFLDKQNNVLLLGSALASTVITYEAEDLGGSPRVNVCPPVSQSEWDGLKVVKISANVYDIYLPPRGFYPDTHISTSLSSNFASSTTPDVRKFFYKRESAWTNVTVSNWASPTGDAVLSKIPWYRYQLPEQLDDLMTSSISAGTQFPDNFLYLVDMTTATVLEGIVFKVPVTNAAYGGTITPRPHWVIRAFGNILDEVFDGKHSSVNTDNPADYRSEFALIMPGNSMASSIKRQEAKPLVLNHASLDTLQPAPRSGNIAFPATYTVGDDHPMYLNRNGSKVSTLHTRDHLNNGMAGDILFLNTSNIESIAAPTYGISFGSMVDSARIAATNAFTNSFANKSSSPDQRITMSGVPVHMDYGTITFGSAGTRGIDVSTAGDFRFFHDSDLGDSNVVAGNLLLVPNSTSVTSTSVSATLSGTMNINPSSIIVRDGDLTLGTIGSSSGDVQINTTADLRILSQNLKFGNSLANQGLVAGSISGSDYLFDFQGGAETDTLSTRQGKSIIQANKGIFTSIEIIDVIPQDDQLFVKTLVVPITGFSKMKRNGTNGVLADPNYSGFAESVNGGDIYVINLTHLLGLLSTVRIRNISFTLEALGAVSGSQTFTFQLQTRNGTVINRTGGTGTYSGTTSVTSGMGSTTASSSAFTWTYTTPSGGLSDGDNVTISHTTSSPINGCLLAGGTNYVDLVLELKQGTDDFRIVDIQIELAQPTLLSFLGLSSGA